MIYSKAQTPIEARVSLESISKQTLPVNILNKESASEPKLSHCLVVHSCLEHSTHKEKIQAESKSQKPIVKKNLHKIVS